jgi:hypothetical protein
MNHGDWFPQATFADDTLPFRSGPLRLRMKVTFSNYQRFGADTNIRFEAPQP